MTTPNIVCVRVDNRLVHGQVGNVWAQSVQANLIVVADDDTAVNPINKALMKMTADAVGIGIRCFSVEETIEKIFKASSTQSIFLVVRTPKVARILAENHVPFSQLNIGNMHFTEGKHVYKEDHVYVDEEDIRDIERLKELGVGVYIQILPNDKKIYL